jgi:hypothetical protein
MAVEETEGRREDRAIERKEGRRGCRGLMMKQRAIGG